MKITIPAEAIRSNYPVRFSVGEPDAAGQQWIGATKGQEQPGQEISIRRQVDADRHEYSTVTVVGRDCPVTGDVILTVE